MDAPTAFYSKVRTARKAHICCECNCVINRVAQYMYSSGIWDGEPDDFKQCLECSDVMAKVEKFVLGEKSLDYDDGAMFGGLKEWFYEYRGYGEMGNFRRDMADMINIQPSKLFRLLGE